MACFGSKTLQRKRLKAHNLFETSGIPEEEDSKRMMKKNSRPKKGNHGSSDRGTSSSGKSNKNKLRKGKKGALGKERPSENSSKALHLSKQHNLPAPQPSVLRKKVDPESAKYFLEIANLFESNGIDLEERPFICGNALDEARGKELELATDMIISHTLQTLLEGCDLHKLCSFLQSCAKDFSSIAMDKYGSHVAETALKSLTVHLHDQEQLSVIENTLTKICEVVVVDPVNVMCSNYGSHVLRSLLCLCKGIPLDSLEEFHVTKVSAVLAERLNIKLPQPSGDDHNKFQQGFPHLFQFLVAELLKNAGAEISTLRVNKYSSFILQTALKLLVGDDEQLLHVILTLLGCTEENVSQGIFLKHANTQDIMELLKDTASSHLMEVILEVAPENLYHEILEEVFKGSLSELSSHHCGNFVVQALISSARCKGQVNLIWEELGPKIRELLATGKSGVVASLLAACQRLQTHGHECCKVLAASICLESEPPSCIIPHLLFLDNYLCCNGKSSWKWPTGDRMHVLGCLMLQTVFRYPNQFIQPYICSIVSLEADQLIQTAKDSGGSRVLESFLSSDASAKEKREVFSKFQNHFGELSLHPSGSFTVEKCFAASNLSLKEAIVSELSAVKDGLSKTKHGPYIIKKLDVDGFVLRPKQWKSSQANKEAVYREFQAEFGSNTKLSEESMLSSQTSCATHKKRGKGNQMAGSQDVSHFSASGFKHSSKRDRDVDGAEEAASHPSKKFVRSSAGTSFVRQSGKRKNPYSELADMAGKGTLSAGEVRKLFKATDPNKQSDNKGTPFVRRNR